MASDSYSDPYQFELDLHIAPSSPMAGANLEPFSGLVIDSGPMSTPHTTTNTSGGGPNTVMQAIIIQLPPPIFTIQFVPPVTHGGSVPSTHTVPLGMLRGSGPSNYTTSPITHGGSGPSNYTTSPITHGGSDPSTHTVPFTTLGGSGMSTTVP